MEIELLNIYTLAKLKLKSQLPKIKTGIENIDKILNKKKITLQDRDDICDIIKNYFIDDAEDKKYMKYLFQILDNNLSVNVRTVDKMVYSFKEHNDIDISNFVITKNKLQKLIDDCYIITCMQIINGGV